MRNEAWSHKAPGDVEKIWALTHGRSLVGVRAALTPLIDGLFWDTLPTPSRARSPCVTKFVVSEPLIWCLVCGAYALTSARRLGKSGRGHKKSITRQLLTGSRTSYTCICLVDGSPSSDNETDIFMGCSPRLSMRTAILLPESGRANTWRRLFCFASR